MRPSLPSVCGNCCGRSKKITDRIMWTRDSFSLEIQISTALSVIFEQNPLDSKSKLLSGAVFNHEYLYFCNKCAEMLTELLNSYLGLIQLCKLQSQVAVKITQIDQLSRLCSHVQLGKKSKWLKRASISNKMKFKEPNSEEDDNAIKDDEYFDISNVEVKLEFPEYDETFDDPSLDGMELDDALIPCEKDDFERNEMPSTSTSSGQPEIITRRPQSQRKSANNASEMFTADSDNDDEDLSVNKIEHSDADSDFSVLAEGEGEDDDEDDGSDPEYGPNVSKRNNRRRTCNTTRGKSPSGLGLPCPSCDKKFSHRSGLRRHNREFHSGVTPRYNCPDCEKDFRRPDDLKKHKRNIHGDDIPKRKPENLKKDCDICLRKFQRPYKLRMHLKTVHVVRSDISIDDDEEDDDDNSNPCPSCDKKFSHRSGLLRHNREFHSDNITLYNCPYCEKQFKRPGEVHRHKRTMHVDEISENIENNTENSECDICLRKFTNPNSLRTHLQTVHVVRSDISIDDDNSNLQCTICREQFLRPYGLRRHMELHLAKKYACPIENCGKTFRRRDYAQDHLQAIHKIPKLKREKVTENEAVRPICEICGKLFKNLRSLNKHSKLHTNAAITCPFVECGKVFARRDYVRDHLRAMHGGERIKEFYDVNYDGNTRKQKANNTLSKRLRRKYAPKVPCEQCGTIVRKSRMKEHITIHSGEKPHLCEICGSSFRLKNTLSAHMREIHNINPNTFTCPHCPQIFKRPYTRNNHVKEMHENNDQIYVCHQCGKAFRHERNLRQHVAVHSNTEKVTCKLCDKVFTRMSNLRNHIKSVHEGKVYHKNPNRIIKKRNVVPKELYHPSSSSKSNTGSTSNSYELEQQEVGHEDQYDDGDDTSEEEDGDDEEYSVE